MNAKSIQGKSVADIQTALAKSIVDGFKPSLAIIFISIKQDRKAVAELLHQNGIDIMGATSCGEFINGHQSEGEIAILLLNLTKESYSILVEEIGDKTIQETATQLAEAAIRKFPNPSLLLCSNGVNGEGELFDGVTLVSSLEKAIGSHRLFYGGMAGDDMTFTGSYVFTYGKETNFGIAALVLDADKVLVQGMAITGWKPMGISRKVTKSKGNLIYTIDGKPATEMYLKYLGKSEKLDDRHFDVFQELSIQYPFIVDRGDGETLLKSPSRIDHAEKALVMDMEMQEGDMFRFSVPPDFDIVEEVIKQATELKNASKADADALLIFSCAGRPPVLGPLVTLENEGLAALWETPMAGFFTYGEYGRAKNGKQHFHSGACCWVTLTEK